MHAAIGFVSNRDITYFNIRAGISQDTYKLYIVVNFRTFVNVLGGWG